MQESEYGLCGIKFRFVDKVCSYLSDQLFGFGGKLLKQQI